MEKRTLLMLSAASAALLALGLLVPGTSLMLTSNIPQTVLLVGAVLFLLGCLGGLAAWIGGLIKTAAIGEWGWFVAIAIFNVIGTLAYALRGPQAREAA